MGDKRCFSFPAVHSADNGCMCARKVLSSQGQGTQRPSRWITLLCDVHNLSFERRQAEQSVKNQRTALRRCRLAARVLHHGQAGRATTTASIFREDKYHPSWDSAFTIWLYVAFANGMAGWDPIHGPCFGKSTCSMLS